MTHESRPPFPPFTLETAQTKVRLAEDAWNSRDPTRVALAYSPDSRWRNRVELLRGRDAVQDFLRRKWARELDYRLIKELWAFHENRIAVRFAYEWHDDSGSWFTTARRSANGMTMSMGALTVAGHKWYLALVAVLGCCRHVVRRAAQRGRPGTAAALASAS